MMGVNIFENQRAENQCIMHIHKEMYGKRMHHVHMPTNVSYIDKGAEEEQMHEHHGKETHQGTETENPNIIQYQQKESTAQEYEHGHWHGCRAAPLHE
jgi:hypothetical protein